MRKSIDPGGFPSERPVTRSFDVFLPMPEDVNDLRRHRAYYDVTVMKYADALFLFARLRYNTIMLYRQTLNQ